MQMNDRCKLIINQLLVVDNCTVKQLALFCGVSYRQAKNYIDEINSYFQHLKIDSQIISVKGKGVILLNKENVPNIIDDVILKSSINENDLFMALICEDYLKIDDFADDNALSRSTVNKYLANLRKNYCSMNLQSNLDHIMDYI